MEMIGEKIIRRDSDFQARCPKFVGAVVYAPVSDTPHDDLLWREIGETTRWLRGSFTTETLKGRPGIRATREAFRACGKDPSRYRPSNEQLCRRILQGRELYGVTTVVDLLNLASIRHGYSIGGFDLEKVEGETVTLGIGREGEPYEGIGRGQINIAGMPVYRDAAGGIGTPMSDHERTKLSLQTRRLMCFVNGYDGNIDNVRACASLVAELLVRFAGTQRGEIVIGEY